jgi:integrase
MGLYRRGKIFWFTISYKGKRIQGSTDTDKKRLAEQRYAKVLTDIQDGRWFENQAKKRRLKEMIDRFEKEVTSYKNTIQQARDKSIFRHLLSYFGENVTLEDVEYKVGGYEHFRRGQITKRNMPPDSGTIRKELCLLRRMFNVARKQWRWKIANPVSDIELPKDSSRRLRYLKADEYEKILTALEDFEDAWLKPVVLIALDTGLRKANLCDLTWDQVNLFNRSIFIEAEKMKNADYHGVPLTDRALETLKELQKVKCISNHVFHDDGKKLYPQKVQRAFRRLLKKAKVEDFRFHDMRHTFASYLRQRGVDLHTIATLLGHKDLRMTQRYAHLSLDPLRDAISKLDSMPFLRAEKVGEG